MSTSPLSLRRVSAFLPAAALGLGLGLGLNAWRHSHTGGNPAPPAPAAPGRSAASSPTPLGIGEAPETPVANAAEFTRGFTPHRGLSPLRSQLENEALTAGLTREAFLALVRDGAVPPDLWESGVLLGRVRAWAAAGRADLLEILPLLPQPNVARGFLDSVFRDITPAEFRALLPGWEGAPESLRETLIERAVTSIARRDPEGALALLKEPLMGKTKTEDITARIHGLLLNSLEDKPAEWVGMFRRILNTAMDRSPDEIQRYFGATIGGVSTRRAAETWPVLRESAVPDSLKFQFLRVWARGDSGAALSALMDQYPSAGADLEARRAYSDLGGLLAFELNGAKTGDPKAWLALAGNVPPGPGRDAFMAGLAEQAASGNPAVAAQLLSQVAPGDRAQTINNIAELWTARDPVAASEWLDTLPPGADRDQAAGGFVRRLAESDPESAAQWAVTIEDAANRRSALLNMYQTWQRLDADAARRWAESESRLTAEDQALLRDSGT